MLKINNQFTDGRTLQKLTFSKSQKKWLTTILMFLVAFIALSEPAFADGFGKIEGALQKMVDVLTGTIAKSIATIAVAGIGLAWIAGYVEMRKAFFVCVGIGIVMGATQIVSMLSS